MLVLLDMLDPDAPIPQIKNQLAVAITPDMPCGKPEPMILQQQPCRLDIAAADVNIIRAVALGFIVVREHVAATKNFGLVFMRLCIAQGYFMQQQLHCLIGISPVQIFPFPVSASRRQYEMAHSADMHGSVPDSDRNARAQESDDPRILSSEMNISRIQENFTDAGRFGHGSRFAVNCRHGGNKLVGDAVQAFRMANEQITSWPEQR